MGNSCIRRLAADLTTRKPAAQRVADFIHKVGLANKEMREALYWLRLVQDAELVVTSDVDVLVREADELIAILTASIKTARQREVTLSVEA